LKKHGLSTTKIYHTWQNMMDRCKGKKSVNYGGRGIKVCKRWHNFINFYNDMGEKPKGLSLERINNNGNYSKKNCRWATPREQQNNTRNNHLLIFNNISGNITFWSRKLKINRSTLFSRLYRGWPIKKALLILSISKKEKGGER
jgi:hypothetical protein